jgi:hypothetical protein
MRILIGALAMWPNLPVSVVRVDIERSWCSVYLRVQQPVPKIPVAT